MCSDTATSAGGTLKLGMARAWVYQRVVGSPPRSAQGLIAGPQYRAHIAVFVRSLTPDLVEHLNLAARCFLAEHGQSDEPLYPDLAETLPLNVGLPQGAVTVDVPELHRLIGDPGLKLTEIARRFGVAFDDVVEILGWQPAPVTFRDDHQRRARGGAFAAARARLTRATVVELYTCQGLGLAEIGARTGVSRNTIRRLLDRYDIAARPSGRPRRGNVTAADT